MEWFRSPLALIFFGVYALVLLGLLSVYFRSASRRNQSASARAADSGRTGPRPAGEAVLVSGEGEVDGGRATGTGDFSSRPGPNDLFREEAEKLFSGDRDPVFATDEDFRVFYGNRATVKLFGDQSATVRKSLAEILGSDEAKLRKAVGDPDKPKAVTVPCLLPNGKDGDVQLRVAVLNRLPRIYAVRVAGFEETRPGWLARPGRKSGGQTSLTRGGHLDFREIDPASVELSADQMLGPLRDIDERLSKVSRSDGEATGTDPSLQAARGRLRKLIRHIEEIDWMLQVTDGHLHLTHETFKAYEVLSGMADAANRLSGTDGARLELSPSEAPAVEPLLSGDRRIFEKILTQLLTSAFRSTDRKGIKVDYRSEPLESPQQSDDWYLFAGEETSRSQASRLTIRIGFHRFSEEEGGESDLPAVIETLGSAIIDPKLSRRLDYVRKGRDSDLFGLTLARELVTKLEGELAFQSSPEGLSEFVLRLQFDNAN